jgi:hypothetical protein
MASRNAPRPCLTFSREGEHLLTDSPAALKKKRGSPRPGLSSSVWMLGVMAWEETCITSHFFLHVGFTIHFTFTPLIVNTGAAFFVFGT